MKKRLHILFMALLAMAVLGGCGADGTGESSEDTSSKEQNVQETEISEEPVYGGSVVVGIQQDIDSLDPHKATAAGTKEILFNVFEGLVKPDENGNLICAVASDYSVSEDGLVYTFTLRDGVKFHNGNDVTCEDVKYSLERAAGLLDGTPLVATLQTIQSVDILDDSGYTEYRADLQFCNCNYSCRKRRRCRGESGWNRTVFFCFLHSTGGNRSCEE